MPAPILVVGSTNTDMVVRSERFPRPGETLLGGTFATHPGGKGANQAVAAARLGGVGAGGVAFVTKVGDDAFGATARAGLLGEGILGEYILTDPDHPSGVALITVDARGENAIVVASGANGALGPDDLAAAAPAFAACAVVLVQLEVPLPTVAAAVALARRHGKRVILNPAPAAELPDDLLRGLFALTPNESELGVLTGRAVDDDAGVEAAAGELHARGVAHVVVTLGARGAYLLGGGHAGYLPAPRVTPVDTTAAGDVFNGALAVALVEGLAVPAAVAFANRAAAVSVTRVGAQPSIPTRAELDGGEP